MSWLRRLAKWLCWSVLAVVAVLCGLYIIVSLSVVPPVSGRVVDAASGKPVAGVEVALHVTRSVGFSEEPLRYEKQTTGSDGEFGFRLSYYWHSPLVMFGRYWLTVNSAAGPEEYALGGGALHTNEMDSAIAGRILSDPRFLGPFTVSNRNYFPLGLEFGHDPSMVICYAQAPAGWSAACRYSSSTRHIGVPLIPVFDDVSQCEQVRDGVLREDCRQLNTYRAAFADRSNPAALQHDEDICEEVDHAKISKLCIFWLHHSFLK